LARGESKKPKIGFLPGVVDPFYQVMEIGVKEAAEDFGLEVVTQYQQTWVPPNPDLGRDGRPRRSAVSDYCFD
jgi:ABC-type sugar transport system substrate-binding protein